MDNYIVRIYRRNGRNGTLHGLVEIIEQGLQKQFHSKEELWQLLQASEAERSQQNDVKQHEN